MVQIDRIGYADVFHGQLALHEEGAAREPDIRFPLLGMGSPGSERTTT